MQVSFNKHCFQNDKMLEYAIVANFMYTEFTIFSLRAGFYYYY